ncbi:hypothetical protein BDV32DRAFT_153083 [Aspergillus pseudonomiae]|uniref:Uncharacterized protein n=1 Tax=Aspergillus pseudonomiae TaxID=1506151 RepID=A0A5N7D7S1_9EURO|nr:uncharacterized protein BDV37DRAFT_284782 [Aspergillus pseudonomiae]KAB8256688.1 hypothetical protein BDV32DRAFT_153083 [Aspergillus pseudonomiae]KAE8402297.1 hypothetical protein BDV37DRAFT_284782 [Aspergillus pseudonomiae]
MGTFEKLPPEIIVRIIQYAADFVGTESLLVVSPWVHAVFEAQPHRITEDLIVSNPVNAMPEIQNLLRNIALVPTVHRASLDHYMGVMCESTSSVLPPQMSFAELFRIVQIAAQVQRLACVCLSTMRQNFISAVGTTATGSLSGAVRAQKASEPFSWVEEYRVYWALWHLVYYSILCEAARELPADSVQRIYACAVRNEMWTPRKEYIWTVAAVLSDLGLHPSYGDSAQQEPSKASWDLPEETPIPLFTSFEFCFENYLIWSPQPVPESTPVINIWDRGADRCDESSVQTGAFSACSRQLLRRNPSSAAMRDIRPFRRLGVLLWDTWRVFSVGLQRRPCREGIPTPDGGFLDSGNSPLLSVQENAAMWLALVGKTL